MAANSKSIFSTSGNGVVNKHTPGPLTVGPSGNKVYPHAVVSDGAPIALADSPTDAALYAAAPDLLVALHDLLAEAEAWGVKMASFANARAALAKAGAL